MFQTCGRRFILLNQLYMNLSYRDLIVRDYCYSINPDLSNNRFTINEIVAIRSHIADLRSASSLADAPINYDLVIDDKGQIRLIVQFDYIKIICAIISTLKNPNPNQIKRIQVLDIVRIDLHLADLNAYSA